MTGSQLVFMKLTARFPNCDSSVKNSSGADKNMKSIVLKIYENRDDVTLTGYVIEDSPELLDGKPRPAVLICPGGGYLTCTDREAEPIAMRFAAMGYHAFVLRYSVYTEGGRNFPDLCRHLTPKPTLQYPAPMLEIGRAILLIREHAREWLVDTDRIALCGFSAGGHNAAMYATKWHTPMIVKSLGGTPDQYQPAALILGYSLTDMVYMDETTGLRDPMNVAFFDGMNEAYVGMARPERMLLEEISPARNVTEHMPPTYLWATAADGLVPVQHTIRMALALADHRIPFELHIFEEGSHGLALANQASAESQSQIMPEAAKWVPLAEKWLHKRLALDLPRLSSYERSISGNSQ